METNKVLDIIEEVLECGKKILPHVREMARREKNTPPKPPKPPEEELRKESYTKPPIGGHGNI